MLKKTNIKTTTFEAGTYKDEYGMRRKWFVDVVEETDRRNNIELYNVSLRLEDYGFTLHMYGEMKENIKSMKELREIIDASLDEYKEYFFEEMELNERAHEENGLKDPNECGLDKLLALYERTLKNCRFYKGKDDKKHLVNEIGCLRGIAYCIEALVGEDDLFHNIGFCDFKEQIDEAMEIMKGAE